MLATWYHYCLFEDSVAKWTFKFNWQVQIKFSWRALIIVPTKQRKEHQNRYQTILIEFKIRKMGGFKKILNSKLTYPSIFLHLLMFFFSHSYFHKYYYSCHQHYLIDIVKWFKSSCP